MLVTGERSEMALINVAKKLIYRHLASAFLIGASSATLADAAPKCSIYNPRPCASETDLPMEQVRAFIRRTVNHASLHSGKRPVHDSTLNTMVGSIFGRPAGMKDVAGARVLYGVHAGSGNFHGAIALSLDGKGVSAIALRRPVNSCEWEKHCSPSWPPAYQISIYIKRSLIDGDLQKELLSWARSGIVDPLNPAHNGPNGTILDLSIPKDAPVFISISSF